MCIMLETAEALEDVEAIMAVPGLDSVCVGANDLMSALGLPYPGTGREHSTCETTLYCPSPHIFARGLIDATGAAEYTEEHHKVLMGAVSRCVAAAEQADGQKFVGFASGNPQYCADAMAHGAHWIQMGADKVLLKQRFEQLYEELADAADATRAKM